MGIAERNIRRRPEEIEAGGERGPRKRKPSPIRYGPAPLLALEDIPAARPAPPPTPQAMSASDSDDSDNAPLVDRRAKIVGGPSIKLERRETFGPPRLEKLKREASTPKRAVHVPPVDVTRTDQANWDQFTPVFIVDGSRCIIRIWGGGLGS